ncbi:hypothetical protein [uncultured Campylobacter sp.]|uniref:hypothetical protein n=1 Tax=uncultured Campylobacter sp. TaxID=218934 RepID=UPI00262C3B60|nr:hypothetical protein [uncultured Campylobacter sp.]
MIFDELMDALAKNGWQIRRRDEICSPQSEFLGGRFKNLSEDFYRFVCSFETLHDAADAVWFVSARDYASSGADEAEFCYGDFEKDSLECAANDAERAAVSAFWSGCLPFLFSVRGERCFAGILAQGADAGRIVFGAEPIYEDTLVIAHNFEEFITLFLAALTDKSAAKYPLSCFV